MMKATASVVNPDDVVVAITVEMKVRDWNELVAQVHNEYPGWAFKSVVNKTIGEALARVQNKHEAAP